MIDRASPEVIKEIKEKIPKIKPTMMKKRAADGVAHFLTPMIPITRYIAVGIKSIGKSGQIQLGRSHNGSYGGIHLTHGFQLFAGQIHGKQGVT